MSQNKREKTIVSKMCFFNVSYKYAVETKTQYIATS